MHDIRDLLSGSLHVERIVFSFDGKHVHHGPVYREQKRTHYCIGVSSGDRFLLVEMPSLEAANEPVDLTPHLERAFEAQLQPLRECLAHIGSEEPLPSAPNLRLNPTK